MVSKFLRRKEAESYMQDEKGVKSSKTFAQENKDLNDQEYKARSPLLRSYPTYVAINLSDVCTVSCKFCRYNFYTSHKRLVTLEDIKSQEWLKYPQTIDLFCGVGESLVNPQFKDIFQYMMETFPYQYRGLTTNGTLMDDQIIRLFLKGASWIHVSVNAFKIETYRDLLRDLLMDKGML